jgi:hypothetical protein
MFQMENVEYGSTKPVISAIFVAITLFVPSMFERTTQVKNRFRIRHFAAVKNIKRSWKEKQDVLFIDDANCQVPRIVWSIARDKATPA